MVHHDIVPRSLPSKLARAGSSHSYFPSAPLRGRQHNWGVKEDHIFSRLDIFFLPRTCEPIVIVFMTVLSELMKRDYTNTGMTIVRMWTLTVIKLLSWKHWWWVCWCQGGFGWKLKQRTTFRNYKHLSYYQGVYVRAEYFPHKAKYKITGNMASLISNKVHTYSS